MSDGDVIRIPFDPSVYHPLGRHIQHDPRNRMFAAPVSEMIPEKDFRWRHYGMKLNQGNVGACTGFAGANAMNTMPYRRALAKRHTFVNEDGLAFYVGATNRDPYEGSYPPHDTGSSGLAVCQELQAQRIITGYNWSFGFNHGLGSLVNGPLMQGTYWTEQMFYPDNDGRVKPIGPDAGGHEYVWVGIEYRSKRQASQNRSWFLNSWGLWGPKMGYFYMTWEDHMNLLARDGDLIQPVV